jgi:hypothetical protein
MSNSGKKMVYLRKKGTSGKQTIEFPYADANYLHLDRPNNFGGGGVYVFLRKQKLYFHRLYVYGHDKSVLFLQFYQYFFLKTAGSDIIYFFAFFMPRNLFLLNLTTENKTKNTKRPKNINCYSLPMVHCCAFGI